MVTLYIGYNVVQGDQKRCTTCTIFLVSLYNCGCFLHNLYNVVHYIVHKERARLACAAAPAPSRACLCSMHQRAPRCTIIMQITSLLCCARQAPAPALPAGAPARPPSAPALARLHRNRGGVLGQNCFFIYLCTAASDPAAKAAVPAMVQIASSGGSSRKLASAPA